MSPWKGQPKYSGFLSLLPPWNLLKQQSFVLLETRTKFILSHPRCLLLSLQQGRHQCRSGFEDILLQQCEMLSPLLVYFALAPPAPFMARSCSSSRPARPSRSKGWCSSIIQHGITSLLVCFLSLQISELIFLRVLIIGKGSLEGLAAYTSAGSYLRAVHY